MKGYKAFHFDLSCRPSTFNVMHYRVGRTYEIDKPIILCERGFHFCPRLPDVYAYYGASFDVRVCEVESLGDWEPKSVLKVSRDKHRLCPIKIVTDKLHIIRELTPAEIKESVVDTTPKVTSLAMLYNIHESIRYFRANPELYDLWKENEVHYHRPRPGRELESLLERAALWEAALSGMSFVDEEEEKKQ